MYENSSQPPSFVSWLPGQEHSLVVGGESGAVWSVDTRSANQLQIEKTQVIIVEPQIRVARLAFPRPNMANLAFF